MPFIKTLKYYQRLLTPHWNGLLDYYFPEHFLMKVSVFKRQDLAVFEDQEAEPGLGHAWPGAQRLGLTGTLGRRARGGAEEADGGRGDQIFLFNLKFESFRLTEIKGPEEKILRS